MITLTATTSGRIGRAWLVAMQHLRDENPVAAVAARRAAGQPAIVGIEQASGWFAAQEHGAYVAAAQSMARALSPPAVRKKLLGFEIADPPAVRWAQANALDKIREITEGQRAAIRAVEVAAARAGTNPLEAAKAILDVIGLTDKQTAMVDSYRRSLESGAYQAALDRQLSSAVSDRTIAAAADRGNDLTPAQIDKAVERYRGNALKMRAETIARTEGLRVAHQGSQETIRQAIARGDIDAEQIVRSWNHHPGKRGPYDRDFHVSMHGQERSWDEPFVSGHGNELMHPGDPTAPASETIRCACVITVRIRPAAGVARNPNEIRPAESVSVPAPFVPKPQPAPQTTQPVPQPAPTMEARRQEALQRVRERYAQAAADRELVAARTMATRTPEPVSPAPDAPSPSTHGDVTSIKPIGSNKGVNDVSVVTFSDGYKGIWKPVTGENSEEALDLTPAGTMYKREVAAARVAEQMGMTVIPGTSIMEVDGVEGSVQEFVKGRPAYNFDHTDEVVRRSDAEQIRLLDFISGNIDRHSGNLLVDKKLRAGYAIDNGQAFPDGRSGPVVPQVLTFPFSGQGLLPETIGRIQGLNLDRLAETLHESGMNRESIRHTLYRARLLQEHPERLEVPEVVAGIGWSVPWSETTSVSQTDFWVHKALKAETEVSAVGKSIADAISDKF